jgi:hypothetical protein
VPPGSPPPRAQRKLTGAMEAQRKVFSTVDFRPMYSLSTRSTGVDGVSTEKRRSVYQSSIVENSTWPKSRQVIYLLTSGDAGGKPVIKPLELPNGALPCGGSAMVGSILRNLKRSTEWEEILEAAIKQASRDDYLNYEPKSQLLLGKIELATGKVSSARLRLRHLQTQSQAANFNLIAREAKTVLSRIH